MNDLIAWISQQGVVFWACSVGGLYLAWEAAKEGKLPALVKQALPVKKDRRSADFDTAEFHLRELAKVGRKMKRQSLVDAVNKFQADFRKVEKKPRSSK